LFCSDCIPQNEAYKTDFPKIEGIPEVPGALPFIGHLNYLGGRTGKNDATIFTQWGDNLSADIVQCRVGNQRTVIVRNFSIIRDLWIQNSNAMIDRPHQPGFLDKLGVDLTGSPMTSQIRRCRAAAMRALGKVRLLQYFLKSYTNVFFQPMWPKYYQLIEPSSVKFISSVLKQGNNGQTPMDIYPYLRQIVFDLGLSLTYGARFGAVDDEFMLTFIKSINAISAVRSSTKAYRHFVPLLRIIPEGTSKTIAAEKIRREHMEVLFNSYKERVANGEVVDCIVSSLGEDKLTLEEIHGTCISLLQAAPDTVASGVYQCVAWLSTPEGQETQSAAYNAIMDAYNGDRDLAWRNAFREDKVPLINSLNKETLRYFTFAPFATPRRTVKDIKYNNVLFPKGITFIMNAQEANHDLAHYGEDAWTFNPYRFIGNDDSLPHLAFGAGSRICPAVAISNRLITAILTRLILAFKMTESKGEKQPNIDPVNFSDVYDELVAHPRFFDCNFVARDDTWLKHITSTS
jgi:phenylacetate 2-hydroxylase